MSKIIGSTLYAPAGKVPTVSAMLTPKSGVTYTDGLPNDWNIMKEIGMSAYTAADNGKVRGVVEGKLVWATKA